MQHSQQDIFQSQSNYGNFHQPTVYVSGQLYDSLASDMQVSGVSSDLTSMQGQMIEQQDGTYIIQLGAVDKDTSIASSSMLQNTSTESEDKFVSNIDVKFCQQEMQFLHENFESGEGSSMPRSIIYGHYTRFCRKSSIEPMNPASFGKLIRLVFAGIKTRRLGTRGNSKYHYYGIRIKPTSSLLTMSTEENACNNGFSNADDSNGDETQMETDGLTAQQREHISFLGDTTSVRLDDLASLTLLDNDLLPEGVTVDDLAVFEHMYKEHCQDILAHVSMMDLAILPKIWQNFWQNGQLYSDEQEDEKYPSRDMLHIISEAECVQKFVRRADCAFYTILLEILIPDVLRPIPGSMTLVLRNFSKNLEPWLIVSMSGIAEGMITAKMAAVNSFSLILMRYTSLNHLAQGARMILQNSTNVSQMLSDLNKVNFTQIHEQAKWVCQCDDRLILQLELEIKKTLSQRFTLEQWTKWLDGITLHILQDHVRTPDFGKAAKQFILKWSFYSSLLLRDLTLRSATSFGSFHIIRHLFNEYLFYTIEHKVAAATGISPIAAYGDIKQFVDRSTVPPLLLDDFGTTQSSRFPASRSTNNSSFVQFAAGGEPSSRVSVANTGASGTSVMAENGVMLALHHHVNQYHVGTDGSVMHIDGNEQLGIVNPVISDQ